MSDAELQAIDRALCAGGRVLHTLAPDRPRARLPSELADLLLVEHDDPAFVRAFAAGMGELVEAILRAFPDNLLWDLDALVAVIVQRCRARADPAAALREHLGEVARLQDMFGQRPINFSYIHDFIYGFDWARWVAKDPANRADIGPYDRAFITRMRRRGDELLDLIAEGTDTKYPPLSDERPRNPFGFRRDPDSELHLHRELARRGLVPVQAWDPSSRPTWNRDFAHERRRLATELGLSADT